MAGLRFRERMEGRLYLIDEPLREIPIQIEIEARMHATPKPVPAGVRGRVTIAGIATEAPVQGTLGLLALGEKRLPYELFFVTDNGRRWHLRGEKDITYLAPVRSLTELPFSIYLEPGEGENAQAPEVARGTLHFDWRRDLGRMLRSLRPSLF